jgi:hypothetical protein
MWREAVIAYHVTQLEKLTKTMKSLIQDSWHLSQESNWTLPAYQSEALPLESTCLVEVIFLNYTITIKLI